MRRGLELCYTEMMDADRQIWRVWSAKLKRFGVAGWVAELLEAAGPLSLLGAQIVYFGQPLLSQFWSWKSLDMAAHLLESPVERRVFIQLLREDKLP